MHIINKAVSAIETMIEGCGISENPVIFEQEDSVVRCPYERGALLRVTFGGRTAGIATDNPIRTTTKPSFMFSASLSKPALRSAAAGIINVVSGFLCTSRKLHACTPDCHETCLKELAGVLEGKRTWCCGEMSPIRDHLSSRLTSDPQEADIILVSIDGMVDDITGLVPEEPDEKYLCVGPSTAGVATLTHCAHHCPYGRTNL